MNNIITLDKLPADLLRFIVLLDLGIYNNLVRVSSKIKRILYHKTVFEKLCFIPITLKEVLSNLRSDFDKLGSITLFSDTPSKYLNMKIFTEDSQWKEELMVTTMWIGGCVYPRPDLCYLILRRRKSCRAY